MYARPSLLDPGGRHAGRKFLRHLRASNSYSIVYGLLAMMTLCRDIRDTVRHHRFPAEKHPQ